MRKSKGLLAILPFCLLLLSCPEPDPWSDAAAPSNLGEARVFWDWLHGRMEAVYDGGGEWSRGAVGCRLPLRSVYNKIEAYARAFESGSSDAALYQTRSSEGSARLLAAQNEGGNGCFGIPDEPSMPEFGGVIQAIHSEYPQGLAGGWIVALPADQIAALYYDHGRSLAVLCREYGRSADAALLPAIRAGADWGLDKPGDPNVNYVSALIEGLAGAYEVTGNAAYLEKAISLETDFVLPRRRSDGSYCHDGHNELVRYHSFILEGHLALLRVLPAGHALGAELEDHIATSRAYLRIRTARDNALADIDGYCNALRAFSDVAELAAAGLVPPLDPWELGSLERCIDQVVAYRSLIESEADPYVREKFYWHAAQIATVLSVYDGIE